MAIPYLKVLNYETYKRDMMPGTDDWVVVAELSDGGGAYEWSEFKAFYSPKARRYFWHGDTGCSCNGWGEYITNADGFENGSREDVLRSWKAFTEEYRYDFTPEQHLDGVGTIRSFKEPMRNLSEWY